MQSGLAAVCLEFPKFSTEPAGRQSGFRLRRDGVDVVVTCAHFTKWSANQHGFNEEAQKYAGMQNGVIIALQTREVKRRIVRMKPRNSLWD